MEYDIGVRLDQLKQDLDELKEISYVLLRMFEKSSPKVYKEVIEEIKKASSKETKE